MFENYHLSNNASIVSDSVPGEESLKLLAVQEECESNNRSYPRSIPLAFDSAKGSILQDVDGNKYIDFSSSCGVFNLGHNNEYLLDKLKAMKGKVSQALITRPHKDRVFEVFIWVIARVFERKVQDKFWRTVRLGCY